MSERYFEILGDRSQSGNYIPLGRELPRTPPMLDVKRHLDFSEETLEIMEADQDHQNRMFDVQTLVTKSEPDDSMLKGMTGYQLTLSDLDFIKKMKEDKLIKKLQGDLDEVQKLLKKETMALELTSAAREKAKAELRKFPSCEELTEWVLVVLKMMSPSPELTDLDPKSLLAMVTTENIHKAVREMQAEILHLGKMVENKRKKEAKERGELEKQIASEQQKIQELMSKLSALKSELAQEEAYKAAKMQLNTQKAAEIKAEKENTSEELQTTKNKVRHPKERKGGVKSTEKLDNAAKQSKSTRTKHTDGQGSLKDVQTERNTRESMNAKQKSRAAAQRPAESTKAAAGPQKSEEKESNPQESVQAVRGRRKPPGTTQTAASQAKNQSKVKIRGAESTAEQAAPSHSRQTDEAAEEAQNAGLRRSKRIASRR